MKQLVSANLMFNKTVTEAGATINIVIMKKYSDDSEEMTTTDDVAVALQVIKELTAVA
jgi:hypothetical protein